MSDQPRHPEDPSEPSRRRAEEDRIPGDRDAMPALVYSATRQRAAWSARSDAELLEGLRGGDELALD